jgi:hypothetical protein
MHGSFRKNIADKPALCSARDYEGLRRLIDACRVERRMKMLDLDTDAGLQSGYFAKQARGMRNFGPQTLGPNFGCSGCWNCADATSGWFRGKSARKCNAICKHH